MNEIKKGNLAAFTILGCFALLGFLVYQKADGATVAAISTVAIVVAWVTRSPDRPNPPGSAVVFAGVVTAAALLLACIPPTPKQQGAIVEGACTVLEAFAASPLEQAMCASAEDLIALEADVRSQRADAGPGKLGRKLGQCKIVHTVCATEDELASAIKARKAAR